MNNHFDYLKDNPYDAMIASVFQVFFKRSVSIRTPILIQMRLEHSFKSALVRTETNLMHFKWEVTERSETNLIHFEWGSV